MPFFVQRMAAALYFDVRHLRSSLPRLIRRSFSSYISFFLAIPTMLGASALKLVKFILEGATATGMEIAILAVGCLVSFLVSMLVIRGLMEYVRKHSFALFGLYRIALGTVIIIYYLVKMLLY